VEQPTERTLAQRYGVGRKTPHRRVWATTIAVLLAIGVAWVGWAAWGQSHGEVTGTLVSFRVESDHAVKVTLTITPDGSAAAHCTVQALASDHTTVGHQSVGIPAHSGSARAVTTTVKTERRATSVNLGRCG
jgi:hypothetical protein